jgi:hypothetical protein
MEEQLILNYLKVKLQCSNKNSRNSFNVPLCSTIESELSSLVCFFGPLKEDNALFGVVSKAIGANEVEELEHESALQEEGD